MRLILTVLAFAASVAFAPQAFAEVVTPPNCHWAPTAADPGVVALWCRGDDGRARPTGQTLAQPPGGTWDGCPRGRMYDGVRCVTEARAVAAAGVGYAPPPVMWSEPPVRMAPEVYVYRDSKGRNRDGLACTEQSNVRICKPIPHY